MRVRAWLIVSLGLNALLGAAWYSTYLRHKPVPLAPAPPVKKAFNPFDFYVRTNVVVRRQNFTWHEVESSDYETYINNLRTIGCPETTIRDIIVADVDQNFSHRRSTEAVATDFQWWRSEPDPVELKKIFDKRKSLEEERRALLTKLLGPDWEKSRLPMVTSATAKINLSGPLLGELSTGNKKRVHDIVNEVKQKQEKYAQTQRETGGAVDPAELARMNQEVRAQLRQVLSPEQMEEFLLRYSHTAQKLRHELRGAEIEPEEFRVLFRARDHVEEELAIFGKEENSAIARRLNSMQSEFEDTLRRTLGSERYNALKLNQDPLFRQTKSMADRVGVPREAMLSMYEISQVTEAERRRIRGDRSLSTAERIEALAAAQAEQQKSIEKILGEEAFEKWVELQERR